MEYELDVKNARLGVVRDRLNGGTLELLSNLGVRLAVIGFDQQSGAVMFGLLTFNGFPKFAMGEAKGRASAGQLRSEAGALVAHGLTVGIRDPLVAERQFDIELEHVDVDLDNVVKIDRAEIRHA